MKLDCAILESTLWADHDASRVFLTALLMAEPFEVLEPTEQIRVRCLEKTGWAAPPGWYGFVRAAGVGIVTRAGLHRDAGLKALETLGEPDAESRSPDFEGRRLIRVDGGYLVLNFQKYRDHDYTAAERMRRYRNRRNVRPNITQAEVEVEVEVEEKTPPPFFLRGGVQGPEDPRARVGNTVPADPDPQDSPQRRAGRDLALIWVEVNGGAADVPLEKAGQHFSAAIHKGVPFGELEAAIRREENAHRKPWKICDLLVEPPRETPKAPTGERIPNAKATAKKLAEDRKAVDSDVARRARMTPEERAADDAPMRAIVEGRFPNNGVQK